MEKHDIPPTPRNKQRAKHEHVPFVRINNRFIISRLELEPNTEYCIPNNSTTRAAETSPTI